MNRTEKALTHYDTLLKIPAFLQPARTQPGNVQKAIAVETCGHFLRNSCTASPPLVSAALPRDVFATMVRYETHWRWEKHSHSLQRVQALLILEVILYVSL